MSRPKSSARARTGFAAIGTIRPQASASSFNTRAAVATTTTSAFKLTARRRVVILLVRWRSCILLNGVPFAAQPQCIQGLAYKDSFGKYYTCAGSSTTTGTQCPANYECYYDGFMWGCCPIRCTLKRVSCKKLFKPAAAYTCSLSADSGRTCGAATSRWYYDTSNQRCVSFTYYGCDGNPNNFPSKYLCEVYCGVGGEAFFPGGTFNSNVDRMSEWRCRVSRAGDKCNSRVQPLDHLPQWTRLRHCGRGWLDGQPLLSDKGCPTRSVDVKTYALLLTAEICRSPPAQGQQCGSVNTQRYYFNVVTKTCTTFTYQGCEGSGNNFGTLAQCQNYCNSAGKPRAQLHFVLPPCSLLRR